MFRYSLRDQREPVLTTQVALLLSFPVQAWWRSGYSNDRKPAGMAIGRLDSAKRSSQLEMWNSDKGLNNYPVMLPEYLIDVANPDTHVNYEGLIW